jgi:hypothetical protein
MMAVMFVTAAQVQQPMVPRELPAGAHVAAGARRQEAAGHDHGPVRPLHTAITSLIFCSIASVMCGFVNLPPQLQTRPSQLWQKLESSP